MNRKAQGSMSVGAKIVVLLSIYFFLVTLSIFIVANASSALGQSAPNISSTGTFGRFINASITNGECSDPRYYINENGERQRYVISTSSLSCEQLFAFNQTQCNSVNDCSWQTVTSGIWWWQSTNETCTGYINDTYLSMGNSSYYSADGLFGGKYLQFTSDTLSNSGGLSVCNSPRAQVDKNTCDMLGCTWTYIGDISPDQSPSITNTIKFMFGFNTQLFDVPILVNLLFGFINFIMVLVLVLGAFLLIKGF